MIDEVELLRRAFEAPEPDAGARERARDRLREAMASEAPTLPVAGRRRVVRHPGRWLGAAAALVAIGLIVQAVLPLRTDPASAALDQLASVAASSRPQVIPPGSVLLLTSQESGAVTQDVSGSVTGVDVVTGQTFTMRVDQTVKTWLAPDGSATRTSTVQSADLATAHDRATWIAMGRPTIPKAGDVTTDTFAPGELTQGVDPLNLPTDPAALLKVLRSLPTGARDDPQVMDVIAQLLTEGNAPPAQRAALLRLLAGLPGKQLVGHATDPLGRVGTAILIPEGSGSRELIFDPSTSAVLATVDLPANGKGQPGHWTAFKGSTVVTRPPRMST